MNWLRVNRKNRCKICDHADWCGYSFDGDAVVCMRIESDKPTHNGGWLHKLSDPIPVRTFKPPRIEPKPDLETLWKRFAMQTSIHHLDGFAQSLGVDTDALNSIGCAWANRAWAFPMKDSSGKMIGIRLRNDHGQKWAITGSHQGLFLPNSNGDPLLFIVEGPTDLAAALTLGISAIGRPSCLGQEPMLLRYIYDHKVRRVVIVSDNDLPGLNGARKLQSMLRIPSCIWCPPCKDLREFGIFGGTANLIELSIRDLVWRVA